MTPEQARQMRERAHKTQADIARALGVSIQTVQRIEYGTRPMPAWYPIALGVVCEPRMAWRCALVTPAEVRFADIKLSNSESAEIHGRNEWPATTRVEIDTAGRNVFFYMV